MSSPGFFTIPGIPVAKGRPRLTTRGGFAHAYTPEKTRVAETIIRMVARKYFPTPLTGPLTLSVEFYLPFPKREKNLDGRAHTKRPDITNLLKTVEDAMNGIAYADDSQLAYVYASKFYSGNPRTVVHVSAA